MNLQKRCGHPGCRGVVPVTETYCAKHKRQASRDYDRKRWQSDPMIMAFYHSTIWKNTAKQVMIRDHGLCQECLRCRQINKAELVDHIVPIKEDWTKRIDENNLEAKCKSCHTKRHGKEGLYR